MKEDGVNLDMSTSKVLLDSLICSASNNLSGTGGVIVSYRPGKVAVNELLVVLRRVDMRLELKDSSLILGVITYVFMDLDAALSLFKEMKEQSLISGSSFGPDICTYNSLIHVLCLVGKVKDALIVCDELKVSGHEPDNWTYRILIQGCIKS